MYTVYAIKSKKRNWIYVGFTSDLEERIRRHNSGTGRSTKPYRPYELIYQEKVGNREEARKREKYFKSGVGKEFLKNLVY